MPLILHENIDLAEIGLWKIAEETDELISKAVLSVPDTLTLSGITAHHRKKEWLATRVLLKRMIPSAPLIKYQMDGRPYLENDPCNISISHSAGYVAVILHPSLIPGIDIELINRKVGRVGRRFLSPAEFDACHEHGQPSDFSMLLHWCAKEAIFKMVPFSDIEFATDIHVSISEPETASGSFRGVFNAKPDPVDLTLFYRKVNDVVIVWGLSDPHDFGLKTAT